MFPIRDASNRIVGFGGRTLADAQPKYLNSPQTEIFDKSSVLFGIQRAQDAVRQAKQAVVVEGYLDAIRAHIAGFTNTVASLGTAITVAQLRSLGRLTDRVVLALDPDAAGQSAAARTTLTALAELTEAKGRATGAAGALDLLIATLPEGHGDPDELIRDAPELWKQTLDAAVDAFDFYFHQTLASLDRSSDRWRQEAIDRLVPVIQRFSSSAAWQAAWLERLATETGVDIQALHRSLPGARPSRRTRTPTVKSEQSKDVVTGTTSRALTGNPVVGVERSLLALLLKVMILPTSTIELLRSLQLREPAHAAIVRALLAWQDTTNYDYEMLREELPEDTRETADGLRALDVPLPEDGKITVAVQYHLARRQQFELQEQLSRATDALSEAATEDRQMAVNNLADLMDQRRTLERALDHLSRLVVQAASVQGTMDQDSGRL
jgi:DNA primase